MRRLLFVSAVATVLALGTAVGTPSRAEIVSFDGSLSIQIGTLPPVPAVGSGVATVQFGTGNVVTQIALDAGAFATSITAMVPTDVFPIVQIKLTGPGGMLQNQAISFGTGGPCTANHPNVICPGNGLGGFAGLDGTALVGLFFTTMHTAGSSNPAGTLPAGNLAIPLGVVGGGSTTTAAAGGIQVTVSGAGWTTGMVAVFNPTATTMFLLHGGGSTSLQVTQTGTTQVFTGSNPGNSQLSLVSPIQIFDNAQGEFTPSIARISLTLPEPGATTLLLAGAGVISALYGLRRRRRS